MAKKDSLITHCLGRAVVAEQGGVEAAEAAFGKSGERLSKWKALKLGVQVTPKASRVAGFIVTWAWAMVDEGRDDFSITAGPHTLKFGTGGTEWTSANISSKDTSSRRTRWRWTKTGGWMSSTSER